MGLPPSSRLAAPPPPGVELRHFHVPGVDGSDELARVSEIATQLQAHLNSESARGLITLANQPGSSSAAVQATFAPFATALGFQSEVRGLFVDHEKGMRPDYYLKLEGTGILLEVERGKTTINNMDLLDFWKCHLCQHAHYLFLVVPRALRQNAKMSPRNEFQSVARRLKTFFTPGNTTNVRGLFVFGY